MTVEETIRYKEAALRLIDKAQIALTPEERARVEICDYELGDFDRIGTAIIIYVNTERVCAKEMVLTPNQLCPEHLHPKLGDYPGKEETFRCRYGEVRLYVPGKPTQNPLGSVPEKRSANFTAWHEIILRPGEQYTLLPETRHWFQAGPEGAVISEFSTPSFDEKDIFIDPDIVRTANFV